MDAAARLGVASRGRCRCGAALTVLGLIEHRGRTVGAALHTHRQPFPPGTSHHERECIFHSALGVAGLTPPSILGRYMPRGFHIDRQSNEFLAIFCRSDEWCVTTRAGWNGNKNAAPVPTYVTDYHPFLSRDRLASAVSPDHHLDKLRKRASPIFSMIRARWCSVVRTLVSSFAAITLFECPSTNSAGPRTTWGQVDRRASTSVTPPYAPGCLARRDALLRCRAASPDRMAFRQSPRHLPSMQPLPWGCLRGR